MVGFHQDSDEEGVIAEINIIPLVDVVLVLLIIFMLTAPLLKRTIDVRLPRSKSATTVPDERLMVTITAKGIVYINDVPLEFSALEKYIQDNAPAWNQRSVYIQADGQTDYEKIVQLLDLLRRYGITRIGLLTRPWVPESPP